MRSPLVSPYLVGRRPEVAALERAVEGLSAGAGGVVLIEGEAGIGKSRLVVELCDRAERRDSVVVQGACYESDRAMPYASILDLLRAMVIRRGGDSLMGWLRPAAPYLLSSLPELAGLLPDVAPAAPLEPEAGRRRFVHTVCGMFAGIAAERPLLVVLEDLHWADDAALEFVSTLARSAPTGPYLLALTCRNEESSPALSRLLAELERSRATTQLQLAPLTLTEVDAQIRIIRDLDRPTPAELLHVVYRLTAGNPFFVEEVLRSLPGGQGVALHSDNGTIGSVRVPRTVQEVVEHRVEQLDARTRGVLELAAAFGQRFEFGLLHELVGGSEDDLLQRLKHLARARLVVEVSPDEFAFQHALTRESVYAGLLARERRALHQRIGLALERRVDVESHVSELAYHFHAAGDWARTLGCAARAASRAHALHAPHVAIEHCSRGLQAAHQLGTPSPPSLLIMRGQAFEILGDFASARDDYESALSTARQVGDDRQAWQALIALGMLWTWRDYERTGSYFREALGLARTMDDPSLVAQSLNRVGNLHLNLDHPGQARLLHREALATFQQLHDRRGEADTLGLLAMSSYLGGDLVDGTRYCQSAVAAFAALDDRQGQAESLATLALGTAAMVSDTYVTTLPPADAARSVARSVALAREIGWRAGEAFAQFNLAYCYGALGDFGQALAAAHSCLIIGQEIEHGEWTTAGLCTLGGLHRELLSFATARAYLERGLANAQAIGSPHWIRHATGELASTLAEQRHVAEARDLVASVFADDTPCITQGQRLGWCARAEIALVDGQPTDALVILDKLASTAPRLADATPPLRIERLRGEALAALGRNADAEATLGRVAHWAATLGARSALWRTYLVLGRVQAAQRRRAVAANSFGSARLVIAEIAATLAPEEPLRQTFLTAATAALPRARPLSTRSARKAAFGGLTEREREVAALIARAHTNAEIAGALVIGERTVETHVANIRAKLGLESRREVAAWAIERGL